MLQGLYRRGFELNMLVHVGIKKARTNEAYLFTKSETLVDHLFVLFLIAQFIECSKHSLNDLVDGTFLISQYLLKRTESFLLLVEMHLLMGLLNNFVRSIRI